MPDITPLTAVRRLQQACSDVTSHVGNGEQSVYEAEGVVAWHHGGRAELTIHGNGDRVRVLRCGSATVAVFGHLLATDAEFARVVSRAVATNDFTGVARLPGAFSTWVAAAGCLRVFVDPAGLHTVYHAIANGAVLVADRAGVLASVTEAPINGAWLATQLAIGDFPPPMLATCPFTGVHSIPAGHVLSVDADDAPVVSHWWHPPTATVPLSTGAAAVAEVLNTAIGGLAARSGTLSFDLSGGMDSTALAFLATRRVAAERLRLLTWPSLQPDHPDITRAHRIATTHFGDVERLCSDGWPTMFTGLDMVPVVDEPDLVLAGPDRMRHLTDVLNAAGSAVHVTGHGGDEAVTAPVPAYLVSVLRRNPVTAWRHSRALRALLGPAAVTGLSTLARPPSYSAWLRTCADAIINPAAATPLAVWGIPLALPSWASTDVRVLFAGILRAVAAGAEPFAADPGQHVALSRIHVAAKSRRITQQTLRNVRLASPFLHGDVLDACLSVRLRERGNPYVVKPLLAAAMASIVPADLLGQRRKSHYNTDIDTALRQRMPRIREMLLDGYLATTGLIDRTVAEQMLRLPFPPQMSPVAVLTTLTCELWATTTADRRVR